MLPCHVLRADAGVVSAAASAGPTPLFADAGEDLLFYTLEEAQPPPVALVPQPVPVAPEPQPQLQLPPVVGAASAGVGTAGVPPECASGVCNSMWGMNRIRAPAAWMAIGMPIKEWSRKVGAAGGGAVDAARTAGAVSRTAATYTPAAALC